MNIIAETDEEYEFPAEVLYQDKPNVLFILQVNLFRHYAAQMHH
jgi:hypothetical protein